MVAAGRAGARGPLLRPRQAAHAVHDRPRGELRVEEEQVRVHPRLHVPEPATYQDHHMLLLCGVELRQALFLYQDHHMLCVMLIELRQALFLTDHARVAVVAVRGEPARAAGVPELGLRAQRRHLGG